MTDDDSLLTGPPPIPVTSEANDPPLSIFKTMAEGREKLRLNLIARLTNPPYIAMEDGTWKRLEQPQVDLDLLEALRKLSDD